MKMSEFLLKISEKTVFFFDIGYFHNMQVFLSYPNVISWVSTSIKLKNNEKLPKKYSISMNKILLLLII